MVGTVGTLSIAGCSTVLPTGPDESSPTTSSVTSSSKPDKTATDINTETSPEKQSTGSFSRGEVIEDFEGTIDSRWQVLKGEFTVDEDDPYQGRQSIVLTSSNNASAENEVGISRSFHESGGLDLSTHDLSIAVRFEQPARGRIAVEFIAPAQSDTLTSRHFIPKELDGWTRIDLGYSGKTGEPAMDAVQKVRIGALTDGEPITVAIDDIRKIPKPSRGKVMFQFDDSHITTYTNAFPKLKARDWPGAVGVIPDSIGGSDRLSRSQMHEMKEAGWDMMSHPHPPVAKPLPQLPPDEQKQLIQTAKQTLETWGFHKGARHVVAPNGRVSTKTVELMQQYHDTNYMFGGTPANATHPSNMYGISRVSGTSPDEVKSILDLAEQFNQLVIIYYHKIDTSTGSSVSIDSFENILDYVKQKQMDVVSPSQFLDTIHQ